VYKVYHGFVSLDGIFLDPKTITFVWVLQRPMWNYIIWGS